MKMEHIISDIFIYRNKPTKKQEIQAGLAFYFYLCKRCRYPFRKICYICTNHFRYMIKVWKELTSMNFISNG
jgi:hypothetical protein